MPRVLCLLLMALFVSSGCEQKTVNPVPGKVTSEDVRRDADRALRTASEYGRQSKEEFEKTLAARLKDLDGEIAVLREKGRDLKEDAKADWDRKLVELENKQRAARNKLGELSRSTAEAWKDVEKSAQSAWEELNETFQDARRGFESSADSP